ncbi:ATP-dependent RecD-like DNA helicase [Lacticaseibacillus pabuli]|uniref:ATP-dependent RecD2 DNA helicase n=1 Tax=Lacticaseibacillus pabuli TaxID=3025672 RepID=A0ABY7X0Y5_9LACO|nr:ATP-dependent RecD-like DNA helicase [Lacticaseibacillus sp. KACC 23028]WDF83830.1 ATP-dependent RecD-like DNA helicase [Lacticaseibacillus sp. KACC 23028]
MNDAESVTGKVESIFFSNPSNLFKILLIKIKATTLKWGEDEIVVKGSFGDITEGDSYSFTGTLVDHPKYGKQFQAATYKSEQPTSRDGLVAYLASERFPGIGKKTAERIVDGLGLNAVDDILADPHVLDDCGVRGEKAATLVASLKENRGMEQVVIGLNGFGLSGNLAAKIYAQYREDSLDIIKTNPYQLVEDIDGVGFRTADGIAQQLGFAKDAPQRLGGALSSVLNTAADSEGDTFVEAKTAFGQVRSLLGDHAQQYTGDEAMLKVLQSQVADHKLVLEDGNIYTQTLYQAEWQIASQLSGLLDEGSAPDYGDERIDKTIHGVEKRLEIDYDETQLAAIHGALSHRIFLLTGGPGTGKTTIINAVVQSYAELNQIDMDPNNYKSDEMFPIMLAAPTGRAAKRMTETTNLPASTIHRLLGLGVDQTDYEARDLPDGLLIIDEMSMVDTYLMKILLNSVQPGMTVIFVGDKDQLPSVGPGQVFADMLASGALPSVELTHIHRQDTDSTIVQLAHAINEGKLPADLLKKHADRSFIACPPAQVPRAVMQVVSAAARREFDPLGVQVLAPMYRGDAGVDNLNPVVQNVFNPNDTGKRKEVDGGQYKYRIGDKVLQLVNNPDKNVFNGEIGIVTGIDKDEKGKNDSLTITFDDNEISYPRSEWGKITLAYATSIHKAQGSEFDMVILPLTMQSRRMLKRNLVYTAVTRAKQFLIMIGEPAAFELAVQTLAANRNTGLKKRLCSAFSIEEPAGDAEQQPAATPAVSQPAPVQVSEPVAEPATAAVAPDTAGEEPADTILTEDMVIRGTIDPLIGMHGVKPADFEHKE